MIHAPYKKLLVTPEDSEFHTVADMFGKEFKNKRGRTPKEPVSEVLTERSHLDSLAAALERHGIRRMAYLSGGTNGYTFYATKHQLVKMTTEDHICDNPIEEINQPLVKFERTSFNGKWVGFEIYPQMIRLEDLINESFAGDLAITESQANNILIFLEAQMARKGTKFYHSSILNVGLYVNGTPGVLDAGDTVKCDPFELPCLKPALSELSIEWDGNWQNAQQTHLQELGLSKDHIYGTFRPPDDYPNWRDDYPKLAQYVDEKSYASDIAVSR